MKNNHEIFVSRNATAAQVVAQVAQHLAKDPACQVVVRAESPNWQQARAAFAAGSNDYVPQQ